MMREIKFRGKDISTGEWVYGSLDTTLIADGLPTIAFYDNENFYCSPYVDPKTIGQLTGIRDKRGNEVYEGDIVKVYFQMGAKDEIEESVVLIKDIRNLPKIGGSNRECKVIGNIYDNPQLLEKGE